MAAMTTTTGDRTPAPRSARSTSGGDKTSAADRQQSVQDYCGDFAGAQPRMKSAGIARPRPETGDHAAIDRRRHRRGGHGETSSRADSLNAFVPDDAMLYQTTLLKYM